MSCGDYLLFLHADTMLPAAFSPGDIPDCGRRWGWFDCRLDEPGIAYRLIEWSISRRAALFVNPTGDQALWVERRLLERVGGIPRQPLMEDVELVRRLRHRTGGHRFVRPVRTSARRWKEAGVVRTVLTMWSLRIAYALGVDVGMLREVYYGPRPVTDLVRATFREPPEGSGG